MIERLWVWPECLRIKLHQPICARASVKFDIRENLSKKWKKVMTKNSQKFSYLKHRLFCKPKKVLLIIFNSNQTKGQFFLFFEPQTKTDYNQAKNNKVQLTLAHYFLLKIGGIHTHILFLLKLHTVIVNDFCPIILQKFKSFFPGYF